MRFLPPLKHWYRRTLISRDEKRFLVERFKVAKLSYPPRYVTVGIGSACSNRCVFCAYHADDAKGISKVCDIPYRMTFDEFRRMVDMFHAGHVPRVHICATGEPFAHNEILNMIDYEIAVYGSVSFQTNFDRRIFETRKYLDEIVKRGRFVSSITTDLLSGDPDMHNAYKTGSDYDFVLDAMEYLSRKAGIFLEAHCILLQDNRDTLMPLIDDLANRGIKGRLDIVHLHPYGFNDATSLRHRYLERDTETTAVLNRTKAYAERKGVQITIPSPLDRGQQRCGSFWSRMQIWPVAGVAKEHRCDNMIIGACNAVVLGEMNSHGYVFDYRNVMEMWNNEHLVGIRAGLLEGKYPDAACAACPNGPESAMGEKT